MKKIFIIPILILLVFMGVYAKENIIKKEYIINEEVTIKNFNLKLTDAIYTIDNKLELIFEIKNTSNKSVIINSENYFKLYDINQVQIPNTFHNSNDLIKQNETIKYTLQYNITDKQLYNIYFHPDNDQDEVKFIINNYDIDIEKEDIN